LISAKVVWMLAAPDNIGGS